MGQGPQVERGGASPGSSWSGQKSQTRWPALLAAGMGLGSFKTAFHPQHLPTAFHFLRWFLLSLPPS